MKQVIILMLILSATIAEGQERVNKVSPSISNSFLSKLDKATGWIKGKDEIWISRENRIPVYESSTSILLDHGENSRGLDNFVSYEFRSATYKGEEFIVFIKNGTTGAYKYPAIKEEWFDIPTTFGYFIPPSEIAKLDSLIDGEINLISLKYLSSGGGGHAKSYNEKIQNIEKNFDENRKVYDDLIFHIWPLKEKGIVQFNIYFAKPDEYSRDLEWSISGFHNLYAIDANSEKLMDRIGGSYGTKRSELYMNDALFSWFYYEANYEDFMKFISRGK